ncbi:MULTISPECIES: DMT family transporter [unclassified Brenneria]|uniref:DMT family transporter n=1 Tax=unclassified Brenneria TaxID=2634434 RepID=UPI001555141D|nr:DMT family transporter [Brenneria sp. hezel4-2-4]MEE3651644.1 DMT family transporter [Brenneria sp. HEZEL_4_2_4]NPD01601.1 EamA family transporter [Brenneria sp. hezel4-2-4]
MSFLTFSLVVLAAFIHASWNLLAKRAASAGVAFVFAYSSIACLFYLPWVVWLLATGTLRWDLPVILCVVMSGAVHLAYSLFLQRGYQVADLSVIYPVARGSAPMLSSIAAFLLFSEPLTLAGVAGLGAIVMGIVLISSQGSFARFRQPAAQKGVRWGAATGSMIAGYTVVDAYGVKVLGIHPVVLDWCSQAIRLVMLLPWLATHRHEISGLMRGKWTLAIAVGVLSPLSYILVLLALRLGAPLSVVAPAREMSMMVGALFGMFILREPVGIWRLVGCLVLVSGVVLLGRA